MRQFAELAVALHVVEDEFEAMAAFAAGIEKRLAGGGVSVVHDGLLNRILAGIDLREVPGRIAVLEVQKIDDAADLQVGRNALLPIGALR